jgi:hypothetical protein
MLKVCTNRLSMLSGGISGLIVSTRSDYGGRSSLVTLMLPMITLCAMLNFLWMFHSSSYGSVFMYVWVLVGLVLMLTEWYRAGMWESRFHSTTSYRINAMGSFIYLIVFESAFFASTYWLMSISRIHGVGDVSYRSNAAGSDLSMYGSWESSEWNVNMIGGESSGSVWMSTEYSGDVASDIMLPIMLNLWILLLVSLLLQFGHRGVQMREMV